MARIFYGVWDGVAQDHRGKAASEIPESDAIRNIACFNQGNPVTAFFGDKGFLVFDPSLNLLEALRMHMAKAAEQSCGKCTPCRMGTKLILDYLDQLRRGEGTRETWKILRDLAQQIKSTSLCGLGQTCAVALLGALDHFADQLQKESRAPTALPLHGLSYITAPCIEACPSKVNVPRYISYLRDGKPTHSLGVILQKYPMAATCGRVCVHFCEMACRRNLVDEAVSIKTLKRYVADHEARTKIPLFTLNMVAQPKPAEMKVAVVGAGPSGVACAYHLLLKGYGVDVYEASDRAGGMADRGIPSYRLPKEVLDSETHIVETLGGKFLFGKRLGVDFSVTDLFRQGYKSVYLAIGCANGAKLGVEGEDPSLEGYEPGIDFLMKVHHHVDGTEPMHIDGEAIVVGGGNVAMDCARSAIRLGASKVHLVYRRTKGDMPADRAEIEAAEQEGIVFHFLTNPTKIIAENGKITAIEVADQRQTEPDSSGRRGVEPIPGALRRMECNLLIAAIGQQIDRKAVKEGDGIKTDRRGLVEVDRDSMETSRPGVFAGGDCVLGPATLIHAMANGLQAARSIEDYMQYGEVKFSPTARMRQIIRDNKFLTSDYIEVPVRSMVRVHHPELDPETRREMFDEVELNITAEDAYREAWRCMRCYRTYTVVTQHAIPEGHTPEAVWKAAP
jgi:formate dehydrogenase beta subunit